MEKGGVKKGEIEFSPMGEGKNCERKKENRCPRERTKAEGGRGKKNILSEKKVRLLKGKREP